MADPNSIPPEGAWLGVKLATAVAGFAGGIVSLSFVRNLTPGQGVLAVFTGCASASYLTPLALHHIFNVSDNRPLENGVAFLIGITAMNLIPGFIKLSQMWKRDPMAFVNKSDNGGK